MKIEEDLWQAGEEPPVVKKVKIDVNAKKAEKIIEKEIYNDSEEDEELEEEEVKTVGKKGKKLHKGSLMPSGGHISWKDEIEKMLK